MKLILAVLSSSLTYIPSSMKVRLTSSGRLAEFMNFSWRYWHLLRGEWLNLTLVLPAFTIEMVYYYASCRWC